MVVFGGWVKRCFVSESACMLNETSASGLIRVNDTEFDLLLKTMLKRQNTRSKCLPVLCRFTNLRLER